MKRRANGPMTDAYDGVSQGWDRIITHTIHSLADLLHREFPALAGEFERKEGTGAGFSSPHREFSQ